MYATGYDYAARLHADGKFDNFNLAEVLLEVRLRARARAYVVGSSVVCVCVCVCVMPVRLEVRLRARARACVVGSSVVCVCACVSVCVMPVLLEVRLRARAYVVRLSLVCVYVCVCYAGDIGGQAKSTCTCVCDQVELGVCVCVCVCVCVMPVLLEVRLRARASAYVVGLSVVCVCLSVCYVGAFGGEAESTCTCVCGRVERGVCVCVCYAGAFRGEAESTCTSVCGRVKPGMCVCVHVTAAGSSCSWMQRLLCVLAYGYVEAGQRYVCVYVHVCMRNSAHKNRPNSTTSILLMCLSIEAEGSCMFGKRKIFDIIYIYYIYVGVLIGAAVGKVCGCRSRSRKGRVSVTLLEKGGSMNAISTTGLLTNAHSRRRMYTHTHVFRLSRLYVRTHRVLFVLCRALDGICKSCWCRSSSMSSSMSSRKREEKQRQKRSASNSSLCWIRCDTCYGLQGCQGLQGKGL